MLSKIRNERDVSKQIQTHEHSRLKFLKKLTISEILSEVDMQLLVLLLLSSRPNT
jgi:hypothetical protein